MLVEVRLKSYYEMTTNVVSSSNEVTIDLSDGNSFTHTTTENVDSFKIINPPTGGTFVIYIEDFTRSYTIPELGCFYIY